MLPRSFTSPSRLVLRLPAILVILGLAIPACAATIFSEDYEVASVAGLTAHGWDYVGANCNGYCTLTIQTMPGYTGALTNVLRMEYRINQSNLPQSDPSFDSHNDKIERDFPAQKEIYARYYYRTAPVPPATQSGYYQHSTSKQHYLKTDYTPGTNTNMYTAHIWGGKDLMIVSQNVLDGVNGDITTNDNPNVGSVPLLDNRWYCIEYHIKMNTPDVADGVEEIWVDGTKTLGKYTRKFIGAENASKAFTNIEVYRQAADTMYRYEDDFVLATTRVGCGSAPDVAPPAKPKNLRTQ